MAKKELNFDKLTLPKKPNIVKKGETENSVEQAVETIHNVVDPTPPTPTNNPSVPAAVSTPTTETDLRLRKISIDIPLDMYQFIKLHTLARTITMREYMIELVQEDIAKRGGKEGLKEFYGFK